MTSWRCVTPLLALVLWSTINLSKQACEDYLDYEYWKENVSDMASLIQTKDSKDVLECTVERECQKGKKPITEMLRHILFHCFNRPEHDKEITTSEKCEGESSETIPYYNFRCLIAKAFNFKIEGCDYNITCKLVLEIASTGVDQTKPPPTTTLSPTTLPEATTAPPTTLSPTTTAPTTLPETTTAPPTTLSPTTTAPTTLPKKTARTTTLSPTTTAPTTLPKKTARTTVIPPTTTATTTVLPPPPTNVTQSAVSGNNDQISKPKDGADILDLRIFLIISMSVNLLMPLAFYLYMRRQNNNRTQWMNSETPLASANGDEVETSYLMELLHAGLICRLGSPLRVLPPSHTQLI